MNHKQIRELINTVLHKMNMWSEDAEELVFLTGLVESNYNYIKQLGTGPARSFWQVEPFTAKDSIDNYLIYRSDKLFNVAHIVCMDTDTLKNLSMDNIDYLLHTNIAAGIAFCRLKYWRAPAKIPSDLEGMAQYWKTYYNTEQGAGTVEHFLAMCKKNGYIEKAD